MSTNTFLSGGRKYEYTLGKPKTTKEGEKIMRFTCPVLSIDQSFLVEDIPELILDLPNMAQNLKEADKQNTFLRIRVKAQEKKQIEQRAAEQGYDSTSQFIRALALG